MNKIMLVSIISVAVVVIAIFIFLFATGIIVTDHSAERGFENSVVWQGHTYTPYSYQGRYHEGKTIAKTTDGLHINEVKEDPTHTFIVLRSFTDQWLLVREDYEIPTNGESIFPPKQ